MANLWVTISLAVFLFGCKRSESSETKFQQYYVQGEKLYKQHCSNCHQTDGSGLGRVFPPLNKSDFMDANFERVVCLIKNGIEGEIMVNGVGYNKQMPAMTTLTDLEIAEISTFIYNNWDKKRGLISVQEINPILSKCDSISD